ncbi:hypothetical protein B0F90DRAFT_1718471 [Multifurca ochricompacta]|uniref:Uncharacterized protein n=1 Tax=Multifurca ochricompacta TaxID=376703 RepID=A0AAD4QNS2_9AGAM|nr:hypothetical protein B0F90DRAFT_1718471 [Multifurca ochricompacta]
MHVEPEIPQDQFHEEDLNPEIFPNLRITEHSIRPPSSALYPSYVATSLPSPDAPSSHDHWISRAFHDVESDNLEAVVPTCLFTTPGFCSIHLSATTSSSLWTGLVQARDHRVKQVPEPTPIPDEPLRTSFSQTHVVPLANATIPPTLMEIGEIARRNIPLVPKSVLPLYVRGAGGGIEGGAKDRSQDQDPSAKSDWVKYSRTCVSSESEYLSTDSTLGSIRHVLPNPLPPGPNPAAAFAHKDRVVRRVARRVAQLPYAVNRFQAPTSRRRLEY